MFQSVEAWGQIRPLVFATAFVTLAAVSKPAWATPTSGDADSGTSSSATSSSGELTEILVTARRRDEDLQKVPVAVNVLGPEALRQQGISRAEDLVIATPDLSVQTNLQGRNSAAFFIRGQGVSTGGVLPSVVTYFNEVPLDSNGGAAFGLYDLDSLQVLRGPQGTLFGRNANGGAVVLTPKAPGDTLEGFADVSYGNYNYAQAKGAITLPISPTLSIRLAGSHADHDGFTNNLSGRSMDNLESDSARVYVRWMPTDAFSDNFVYNWLHSRNNGTAGIVNAVRPGSVGAVFYPLPGLPLVRGTGLANDLIAQNAYGPRTINDPSPYWGEDNRLQLIANTASFRFGNLTLKNITGIEKISVCGSDPVTSTLTNFYISTCLPNSYSQGQGIALHPNVASTQITNETNLSGQAFDNRLDWIGGAFVLWNLPQGGFGDFRADRQAKSLFIANFSTIVPEDKSQALYTQGTYAITDTVKVTGGVRYTWDERELQFGQITSHANGLPGTYGCASPGLDAATPTDRCFNTFKADFNDYGYNFDVEWQARPDLMVYLATRKGYKSGGFNSTSASLNPEYKPETLKDVELGEKFQWGGGDFHGTLNTSVFYGWYSGIQQQLTAVVHSQATVIVTNAGNAKIRGLEWEGAATFYRDFTLSAYFSYLDGRYDKCPSATSTDCFRDGTTDVTSSRFLGVAKNTFSTTARYVLPLGAVGDIASNVTYYIRSSTPYAADNVLNYEAIAPAYNIFNARIEWENIFGKSMSAAIFGNNLSDRNYVVSGYGLGGLIGTDSRVYGDPRTYGAEFYVKF